MIYDPVTMPEECGEHDCPVGWHLALYDEDEDGPRVGDVDGNWDPCDGIPTSEEIDAAWRRYYAHVAATGEDPLGEVPVPRTFKLVERWTFDVSEGIAGVYLLRARRGRRPGGSWLAHGALPEAVRQYLLLDARGRLCDEAFTSLAALRRISERHGEARWVSPRRFKVEIARQAPRRPEVVARQLRAAARRLAS